MQPDSQDPIPAAIAGHRVLAFCDWYSPRSSGGSERVAWEIYRRLARAGALVRVVSAAHGPPHQDPGVEVDVVRGFDLSALAGGYLAPAPGAFRAARRAVRSHRPDVIHVNTIHFTGSIAGARAARRSGIPLVVTVHLGSLEHLPGRARVLANAYERSIGGYILRRADRVLAVSGEAARHAVVLGARAEVVSVAPNGTDHERFDVPPLVPTSEPLVMSVGRLTTNKGPRVLLDAAGLLARDGVPFRLAFVGDGPERATLVSRASGLGIADRVEFPGHVEDVERWMDRAEVVVRSSYTEGLALAVLEAMAAGRCNVVSDIPANLEVIDDGVNGLTFRCGDAADLARALGTALGDAALRQRLGQRAREDARRYTWDDMAARHAVAMLEVVRR